MTVFFSIEDILLLPLLIGYTAWWAYDLRRGTRVRRWTLGLHITVYALASLWVWIASLFATILAGFPWEDLIVWFFVLPVFFYLVSRAGLRYGRRRIVLYGSAGQTWHYRGPVSIALFWLSLYVIRWGLEDGLLGGFSVFLPFVQLPHGGLPAGVSLAAFFAVVLVVASLYFLSFGFLLGITLSVWGHHRRVVQAARTSGVAPALAPVVPRNSSVAAPPRPVPASTNRSPPQGFSEAAPVGAARPDSPGRSFRGTMASMPPGEMPVRSNPGRYCVRCGSRFERPGHFCPACGARR